MSGLPSYDGLGAPDEIRADAPEGIGAPPHGGWRGYYLTAYGIAVKHGFRGSEEEWLKTLAGERGERAELRFNGENKCLEYMYASEREWRTLCELGDIQGDMVTAVLEEARGYAILSEEHEQGAERHEAASERYTAEAESWAHGETGVRKGEDEDNGKYYARVAAARAADAEDSAVRAETAAETAAEDASRHAVEDAAELLSGYVSDAETARSGAESAEAAARSSEEQAAASAEAAQSSAEASENSAKNSAESENAADAARRSAEAARDAAEAADEKAQLERIDAELAREGAEAAAKDSAAARDAAAASAEASERAAVRAEEIVGQDFATKEYVADAVSAHDASPEAHADIRAELEQKADETSVASRLADKADKKGTEDALAKKADDAETKAALAKKADDAETKAALAEKAGKDELEAAKTAAATALSEHDASGEAHGDIRTELAGKADDAETKTALEGKVDSGVYEAAMKNKADLVEGKVKAEQLPEMNYDPEGSADAVDEKLSAHTEDVENPHKVTAEQAKARPDTWMPTAADVHARADTWMPSAADVGAVPTTRTVNGHALSEDITLGASDVNAVPTTRKVNGKALAADVTIGAGDIAFEDGETFQEKLDSGSLKGDKGDDGSPGKDGAAGAPGAAGANGKDGVSPTVATSTVSGGTKVTITDAAGAHEFTVKDGAKGADGTNGAPGAKGDPGPNTVSTETETEIEGLLKGVNGKIAKAVENSDYLTPSNGNYRYLSAVAGGSVNGDIDMMSHKITGLRTPTASTDAATKGYVDDKLVTSVMTWYSLQLKVGNDNTNSFSVMKSCPAENMLNLCSFDITGKNGVVTGYYHSNRRFSCPVMLYANDDGLKLIPYGWGHTITYIYDGAIKTKYITEEMYKSNEPLETMAWMKTLTILAVV